MYTHSAYGLDILSPFALPGLPSSTAKAGDVTIRLDDNYFVPAEAVNGQPYLRITEAEAIYFVRSVGLFQIRNGREVIVNPAPERRHDLAQLRLFVMGVVMTIVLHQRGLLVLHGSVAAINGKAVAFLGNSGWGKSSTAAALYARNHMFISDDVMAIELKEGKAEVLPAFPQFKVAPEAARVLGFDESDLIELHPGEPKRGLRIQEKFPQNPIPLKHIYVLDVGDTPAIESLTPQEAIIELIRHSFINRKAAASEHLHQCAQLFNIVPLFRLRRVHNLAALPDLAQLVEKHVFGYE